MGSETRRDRWERPDLSDKVAVVTGASRGVGRGVAVVLGECGATVYVTARSTRLDSTTGNPDWTIDAVVEEIERKGGVAVPIRCDYRSSADVEALFQQVERERGRLDILVNNVVGWSDIPAGTPLQDADAYRFIGLPVWQQPIWWWDGNFAGGVRAHVVACRFGIPLMLGRPGGVVLFTSELPAAGPAEVGDTVLDLRARVTARLVAVVAEQLRPHGIAAVLLFPGWTRTEEIIAEVDAGTYSAISSMDELHEKTASPHYAGRAAASLATDPGLLQRSGTIVTAGDLARELDFTDIDGSQPAE